MTRNIHPLRRPNAARRPTILLVTLAAALGASCGGGETKTVTVKEPAGAPPKATRAEEDCDSQGINVEQGREGTCTEGGEELTVVDRDSTLELDELSARLVSVEEKNVISGDRPDGVFVVIELEVTNKLDEPQDFGTPGSEPSQLNIGEKVYTADTDTAILLEDSFVTESVSGGIQPDGTKAGKLIFDLPESAATKLDQRASGANLVVLNFTDVDAEEPAEVGIIRLWQ